MATTTANQVNGEVKLATDIDPGDKIAVSMSMKRNLGNYETMDLYASASITVRFEESVEEAYKRAWDIVDNQLEEKMAELETYLAERKSVKKK